MNTTQTTAQEDDMQKVQIIEKATGRVTREEWAGGLTESQQARLVRNLESAVRGDGAGRYEVRVVRDDTPSL